jgi:hypothetical protein
MNWRRGLFWLWIVGSALFVIAVAFISFTEIKEQFDAAAAIAAEKPNRPLTDAEVGIGGPAPWTILAMWAGIAFGIPLVVLVLGASLVWAFSGFAAKRP